MSTQEGEGDGRNRGPLSIGFSPAFSSGGLHRHPDWQRERNGVFAALSYLCDSEIVMPSATDAEELFTSESYWKSADLHIAFGPAPEVERVELENYLAASTEVPRGIPTAWWGIDRPVAHLYKRYDAWVLGVERPFSLDGRVVLVPDWEFQEIQGALLRLARFIDTEMNRPARIPLQGPDDVTPVVRIRPAGWDDFDLHAMVRWLEARGVAVELSDSAELVEGEQVHLAVVATPNEVIDAEHSSAVFAAQIVKHGVPTYAVSETPFLAARSYLPFAFGGGARDGAAVNAEQIERFARMVASVSRKDFGWNDAYFSCFLSHSSTDKDLVRAVYGGLSTHGVACWLDEHQLVAGDGLNEEITRGIHSTDKLVLFCSEASLGSWWVGSEVEHALARERQLHANGNSVKLLVPVDLDGTILSDEHVSHAWAGTIRQRVVKPYTGSVHDIVDAVLRALTVERTNNLPPKRL